jgi:RND superfamily putative drug exporter
LQASSVTPASLAILVGMRTLARLATRYRWYVIAGWVVLILAAQGLAAAAGGSTYRDVFTLPHTETQTVLNLLRTSGQASKGGQTGNVVVYAKHGTLDPRRPPVGLLAALHRLCSAGLSVASASSPWGVVDCSPVPAPLARTTTGRNPFLSTDDRVGIVMVSWQYGHNAIGNVVGVRDRLAPLADADVGYEFTGGAFDNLSDQQRGTPPELIGFLAALVILALVFRTVGAAATPLLSAAAALGVGLGIVSLLSHVMNVATFATQLAQLMVIGVGVDYALFIVTRHRRNLLRGMPVAESIAVAVNTSGRAVLFAGATVCVAILGLCALGVSFLYGVAVGTAIAVALTMAASLTLLPAVLALLGLRVLPRRARAAIRAGTYVAPSRPTRWTSWAGLVERHGAALGAAAAALIVVLAVPFFALRLGRADASSDPAGSTTHKGFELIAHAPGFGPGYNSTLELVVSGPDAADPGYLHTVAARLARTGDVNPTSIRPTPVAADLALVPFKTTTAPQDARTTALVHTLRAHLVPALEHGRPDRVYVFGQTAIYVDFAAVLAAKIPLFFAAIVGLSFLLLMLAFRSLLVPLTAAVMNLFGAGAAFGILVAVFQWGWLSTALGAGGGGPVEAFLPVLFFAILFGLSMDYQVFLVSRMHEEWVHSVRDSLRSLSRQSQAMPMVRLHASLTDDNRRAVRVGQAETGGIITAAAAIMIAVFAGFLLADARVVKMVGLGLGGAIFIDAFVLRTVLVPAVMHRLGTANWWYPRWLDRLTPRVSVEPPDDPDSRAARRAERIRV